MNKEDMPMWFRILNIEDTEFEKSNYAGANSGKFRLKDLGILRKIAPKMYESAAEEVKEYSEFLAHSGNNLTKVRLGKKIGSIPLVDVALHPELSIDPKAQDQYWKEHPEMKVIQPKKYV